LCNSIHTKEEQRTLTFIDFQM